MHFYMSQEICNKLSVPYENDGGCQDVNISSLLLISNASICWNDHHRAILSGFVRAGIYRIKFQNKGFGKFKVLNYPSLLNPD